MNPLVEKLRPYLRRLLFIPPIALGCWAVYYATQIRKAPERVVQQESARVLRVVPVQTMAVVPRAIGFGTAQPARDWAAVAEVKGRIVELHPELNAGSFITAGSLLVRIDSTDTQLAIDRLQAEIKKSRASLSELLAQQSNFEQSLEIEKQVLAVNESELAREQQLVAQGAGSTADVDARKRSVISERQAVQNILSNLNLLPSQIESAQANIAVTESNLAERKRDLARCEIRAPYSCRLGPVDLDLDEYVALGQQLLTAQSTDRIEVEAQFAIANVDRLVRADLAEEIARSQPEGPLVLTQELLRLVFDVEATVRYGTPGSYSERKAKFERLREELDAQTRTVGIVVSIDDPYGQRGRDSPPPVSGTYCEVELKAEPLENAIVIPRIAKHSDHVFVLDAESRLQRRKIETKMVQGELVVVASGLRAGEQLVVSDPTPAIEGMLVSAIQDEKTTRDLEREATGEPSE